MFRASPMTHSTDPCQDPFTAGEHWGEGEQKDVISNYLTTRSRSEPVHRLETKESRHLVNWSKTIVSWYDIYLPITFEPFCLFDHRTLWRGRCCKASCRRRPGASIYEKRVFVSRTNCHRCVMWNDGRESFVAFTHWRRPCCKRCVHNKEKCPCIYMKSVGLNSFISRRSIKCIVRKLVRELYRIVTCTYLRFWRQQKESVLS